MDLSAFKYGGGNITGFRLVDPMNQKVRDTQREWNNLNPNTFRVAGLNRKLKVQSIKSHTSETSAY